MIPFPWFLFDFAQGGDPVENPEPVEVVEPRISLGYASLIWNDGFY